MILSRHEYYVEVSQLSHVQLKMSLQRLRRVRNDARLFHLVGNEISTVRLLVSSHQFQKFVQRSLPRLRSWNRTCTSLFERTVQCCLPDQTFRTSGTVVCKLRKPLFPAFLTTFRAPFCVSIVSKYSKVADCCSCGGVAITTVGDWSRCFQQGWIGWIERTCVSVEREVPVVKVFARCERLWLSDSHVLWARFRHRLSHRSHSFRESCHCCVHRSARRLLTNFFHSCSELLELTSQHLNFLSGCHHHSTPQFQDNMLRYHARVGNNTHRVQVRCAQWMMRAIFS